MNEQKILKRNQMPHKKGKYISNNNFLKPQTRLLQFLLKI